ncbi:unnamed protein product [Leptosia nina]|uniref:Uncharacterized protein n=1 Tax=Leptosia nina TaxID=320188 RepID=A0AAV1K0I1_9NEOP
MFGGLFMATQYGRPLRSDRRQGGPTGDLRGTRAATTPVSHNIKKLSLPIDLLVVCDVILGLLLCRVDYEIRLACLGRALVHFALFITL